MGKVKSRKNPKVNKELQIVPRLRLEPRLKPKLTKKSEDKQIIECSSEILETNEICGSISLASSSYDPSEQMTNGCEKDYEASYMEKKANEVNEEDENHEIATEVNKASKDKSDEKEGEMKRVVKPKKLLVQRSRIWNDQELMDLAVGLQNEGFADLKKVAEYVKTKNENDINVYLKKRCQESHKRELPADSRGRPNSWNTLSLENLSTWPNVRKWRKLAYDQMLNHIRSKDYSKTVILALCKKFYEEENEPTDPQVINVKMIYKYIMDCMSGEIPPQLPPKESALVLDLLREVQLMPMTQDFEEELKFLRGFKEATKFRPFEVKDEFKKQLKKAHDNETLGPNTVSVPEEVFMDLSRHKKLIQSFNPLVIPVWMLQKEQEMLKEYFEESNVYVD